MLFDRNRYIVNEVSKWLNNILSKLAIPVYAYTPYR